MSVYQESLPQSAGFCNVFASYSPCTLWSVSRKEFAWDRGLLRYNSVTAGHQGGFWNPGKGTHISVT